MVCKLVLSAVRMNTAGAHDIGCTCLDMADVLPVLPEAFVKERDGFRDLAVVEEVFGIVTGASLGQGLGKVLLYELLKSWGVGLDDNMAVTCKDAIVASLCEMLFQPGVDVRVVGRCLPVLLERFFLIGEAEDKTPVLKLNGYFLHHHSPSFP